VSEKLRFAEAVCAGHPDRLADTIAERVVALATSRDPDALVGVEVALHRNVVFVDGRVAAGRPNLRWTQSMVAARSDVESLSSERRAIATWWNPVGATLAPTVKVRKWSITGVQE